MRTPQKIIEVTIVTEPAVPSNGIVRVSTADKEIRFEITPETAHKLCTDLERFLTR